MRRRRRRKHHKPVREKGPSTFFLLTLAVGLLFLFWMVIQFILTDPLENKEVGSPEPEARQEASP